MSTATSPKSEPLATSNARVHRIEVRARPGRRDAKGEAVARQAKAQGFAARGARFSKVYLIEGELSPDHVRTLANKLLADPVTEEAILGASPTPAGHATIEVHPLPGVMDPAAQSVREAIRELLGPIPCAVSTGARHDLDGLSGDAARAFAARSLSNAAVHQVTLGPWTPARLPVGHDYALRLRHIPIRNLSDDQLVKMSRDAHLFLSLDEMRAVREEYRTLGREPTDIELETIAQTWSEHCVHKTLKATVRYREDKPIRLPTGGPPGHVENADGSVTIKNLLKSTIAAATFELMADGVTWPLSVFKDNSGVVEFDHEFGVCIKVETHNRPSAIEPYGGAATGAGGCIRDVIGTGLGAHPIANTDVFCVAHPASWGDGQAAEAKPLPPGTLHPRRILTDVVAGVRDYGNRMGIPTINGAVHFDDRYVGNPLVFCGCIGLIPRTHIKGQARAGDRIIALGGRTGRDGIHGATFSSAELEQTASTEFAHAVQIGNAIEEKRVLDAIMRARACGPNGTPLYHAMTDCGAGGFSSAVGEMGGELGAMVTLETAPLKYAGLSYTEIWISEAQERMVLAVPPSNVPTLRRICEEEGIELADLGHFGTPGKELILTYAGTEVGRLPMEFLHDGIPMPTREAVWGGSEGGRTSSPAAPSSPSSLGRSVAPSLMSLLSHPTIASKHWIIRQYDHEVQGQTVLKPLVGPGGRGPGDASVITPVPGSPRGVAIACGLSIAAGDPAQGGDPYQMALAGIDECVRNLVCVGADPSRIAILDNFCWPSCDVPRNLGALVRACQGCYDGAKAYRTPFVSGKDSLNNQLRYADPKTGEKRVIEIPYTLLITGLGIVGDTSRCVSMDAKRAGNVLLAVGPRNASLRASVFAELVSRGQISPQGSSEVGGKAPTVDLKLGPRVAGAVATLIARGLVRSAHDASEGGILCAVAEMLIAGSTPARPIGCAFTGDTSDAALFGEGPSRYVLEVDPRDMGEVARVLGNIDHAPLGTLDASGVLRMGGEAMPVEDLAKAWRGPLDW